MSQAFNLDVNLKLLRKQIKDVLESDMPEDSKTGVHNLLGEIRDQLEYALKTWRPK